MHVAVKEVTQPVHAANGGVTHRPGEQFGQDVALPEGVWWRWAVAEVPDPEPEPAPKPAAAKPPAPAKPAAPAAKTETPVKP
jgi:hypothetical protein